MPQTLSAAKRRRWILRHVPQHVKDADYTGINTSNPRTTNLPPHGHTPSLSQDAALSAFAQLAAIRLGADRGLVSLIDDENQYILAESTPRIRLKAGARGDAVSKLWLGSAVVPRELLICATALQIDHTEVEGVPSSLIIPDLSKDERFEGLSIVSEAPGFRFYAAAPIRIQDGTAVGSICVYSTAPRHDVPTEDIALLEDIASTVIEHLAANELKQYHEQGERMTRGLIDFVAGADELQVHRGKRLVEETSAVMAQTPNHPYVRPEVRRFSSDTAQAEQTLPTSRQPAMNVGTARQLKLRTGLQAAAISSDGNRLQNSVTPDTVRNMFSRAANIIRETSDLSGVIIFDTSVAALGDRGKIKPMSAAGSPSTSSSERDKSSEGSSGGKTQRRMSQVLGFSIEYDDTQADVVEEALQSLPERTLLSMLKRFPSGRVFNINHNGELSTSDESDSSAGPLAAEQLSDQPRASGSRTPSDRGRGRSSRLQRIGEALQRIAPDALSIGCLPLWDHDRSRWYAMTLVWTKRIERTLTPDNDLLYLRAFGNSIMMELSRLDHISANQTKNTFIASISHELRSPLHGILGGVEFLQETDLNMFQRSMLHSISTCSHTLLDTLSHVLDFADVSQLDKRKRNPFQNKSTKPGAQRKQSSDVTTQTTVIDLGAATEQVVEAIFASQSYRVIQKASGHFDSTGGSAKSTQWSASGFSGSSGERKLVRIVLDLSSEADWKFKMSPGAWGRLVMNLLGNALKYTNSGLIRISLTTDSSRRLPIRRGVPVYLSVSDTGIGMSKDFLTEKLFVPFSQEDALSTGIGLGMSIVRHLVESMHGKIEVQSEPDAGTTVKLRVQLEQAKTFAATTDSIQVDSLANLKQELQNRQICILKPKYQLEPDDATSKAENATDVFVKAIESTLSGWLGMNVVSSDDLNDPNTELVILVEPSFEYLAAIRSRKALGQSCPITIFLAIDAVEAAALRADARVLSTESVVEICSQPCGPYKMANLISHCLARYKSEGTIPGSNTALDRQVDARSGSPSVHGKVGTSPFPEPEGESISRKMSRVEMRQNALSRTASPANIQRTMTPPTQSQQIDDPSSDLNVLVVDDNAINRRLLMAFCKRSGFNCFEVCDGLQALNEFKFRHDPDVRSSLTSTHQRFNIILTDLSMPIMDGMTATREMRRCERQWLQQDQTMHSAGEQDALPVARPVYIVALTGLASQSARFEAMEAGVDLYMTKPVNFQNLQEVIEQFNSSKDEKA